MPFEEPSTTCVISHVIVLLIAILKGSSDQHRAALQQKLRVGPGKQLIPKAEISAVLEFHALHEEKKKKKGEEQNHKQNTGVTQNKLPLSSPTLLLWDWQKSLDYKHEGPTHKTIKQIQCFYQPPTSKALCKLCVSQNS